jgi:hypothetical protein
MFLMFISLAIPVWYENENASNFTPAAGKNIVAEAPPSWQARLRSFRAPFRALFSLMGPDGVRPAA